MTHESFHLWITYQSLNLIIQSIYLTKHTIPDKVRTDTELQLGISFNNCNNLFERK